MRTKLQKVAYEYSHDFAFSLILDIDRAGMIWFTHTSDQLTRTSVDDKTLEAAYHTLLVQPSQYYKFHNRHSKSLITYKKDNVPGILVASSNETNKSNAPNRYYRYCYIITYTLFGFNIRIYKVHVQLCNHEL